MHREQVRRSVTERALYLILALAVATVNLPVYAAAGATEQKIDLDGNPLNGAESKVSTRVLSTYPVQVENTVFNNAGGRAWRFDWPGAGPAGFTSSLTVGPDVGARWVWTSTSVIYSIESPITFTPSLSVPVFGQHPGGVFPVEDSSPRVFMVPGKSILPTQVTLSNASLTSSLITFFSPAETKAVCGVDCVAGQCDMFVENLSGGTATIRAEQPGCCPVEHQIICEGECRSYLEDVNNCGGCGIVCGTGEICSEGACGCPEGETQCGEGCVNLGEDPSNCGECGTVCFSEESCSAGSCVCPEGESSCGEVCVNLGTDVANCGECGTACIPEESCSGGSCVCPEGESRCGDVCVNLGTDVANCGTCGTACLVDESCSGGACVCPEGETQCGAGCVDLGSDESHCGACGSPCGAQQFCYAGGCFCLTEGLSICGGACVDLQSDLSNCGSCHNVCVAPLTCGSGACVCPGGDTLCGESCVDVLSDNHNCGSCGTVCAGDQTCSNGACVCPGGEDLCGETCVDLQNDESNCGTCGTVCGYHKICSQGVCIRQDDDDDHFGVNDSLESAQAGWQASGIGAAGAAATTQDATDDAVIPTAAEVSPRSITVESSRPGATRPGAEAQETESRSRASSASPAASGVAVASNKAPAPRGGNRSARVGRSQARTATETTVPESKSRVGGERAKQSAAALAVEEAPVCDIEAFEQVVPDGGVVVVSQTEGRFGREVQTTVTIEANGAVVAQGPCPVIVPVTDADTTGVILSAVKVATVDSSGDGLCQPGEEQCGYLISLVDVGDTACMNPMATLSSPPDEFNTTSVVFQNNTSSYPSLPGYPGSGMPLEEKANLVPFTLAASSEHGSNVGRMFQMTVDCANVDEDVVVPIVLGLGGTCDPATDLDGQSYDSVDGFLSPVNARLVLEGGPVKYSTRKFSRGSTIPLKVTLRCGAQILGDEHIEPNPEIVSIVHNTLGPQPLANINGHDNANPDDPDFSCVTTGCDYQLRTSGLPIGVYVVSVKMPDARVFQAGFTIKP